MVPRRCMPEGNHTAQHARQEEPDQRSHRGRSIVKIVWLQNGPTKDHRTDYDDQLESVRQVSQKFFWLTQKLRSTRRSPCVW